MLQKRSQFWKQTGKMFNIPCGIGPVLKPFFIGVVEFGSSAVNQEVNLVQDGCCSRIFLVKGNLKLWNVYTLWIIVVWISTGTVDDSEIRQTHQLRLVVYLIIYRFFLHPRWLGMTFLNHHEHFKDWVASCLFHMQLGVDCWPVANLPQENLEARDTCTKYVTPWKLEHQHFLRGDTFIHGCFFVVMLVFQGVVLVMSL